MTAVATVPARRGWANPDGLRPAPRSAAVLRRRRAVDIREQIALWRAFRPIAWAGLGEVALRRFRRGQDTADIAMSLGIAEPVIAAALTDRREAAA